MKGLMVALLTLLTAGYANAQQQGQNDEGGTFVLRLTEPQFENLLENPEGLVATIPEDARGEVTRVVVKLAPDVLSREWRAMSANKPGIAQPGSTVPALPPQGTQSTQSPFRTSPNNSRITNPSTVPDFNPTGQVAQAGGQPMGGNFNSRTSDGSVNSLAPNGNSTQPWLAFGDNTDFTPVVRKNQWIQPPERANHLANNDFDRNLNDFSNPNRLNGQNLSSPDFNQNSGFQNNGFQNRDRSLDVARRNAVQPDFNDFRRTDFNSGTGQTQPLQQNNEQVTSLQNQLDQSRFQAQQQDQEIQTLRNEIRDLKNLALASAQRQNDQRMGSGYDNRNYDSTLTYPHFDAPRQDRIASNRSVFTQTPTIRNVDNNTGGDEQESTGDASTVVQQPSQELIAKNQDLAKANTFLLFMLLFSIGLNIYLGLIARSFYMRYAELADELRETFTATM